MSKPAAKTPKKPKPAPPILSPFEPDAKGRKSKAAREAIAAYDAKPFYSDRNAGISLYRGDTLAMLEKSRSEQFDMIFADPPYFLSNNGITCQAGKMVSVNKGKWDKAATYHEVHEFNLRWLKECHRLLKPNGTIWVSGTSHNIYSIGHAMRELGYKILNDIAWYKVNPPPNLSCRYFTHATETVLWARKSEKAKHVFNYDVMRGIGDPTPGKQMQSLWKILPPTTFEKRYSKHPTQKPERLLDRIVLASTNPGDLVLDPFLGSGTTGVSCAKHGRRFIGFEIEDSYLENAARRLKDAILARQPSLDLLNSEGARNGK
ncbi:MAG: site-specific DNA-methyltransferase [Fimbriimonadales bacterium]